MGKNVVIGVVLAIIVVLVAFLGVSSTAFFSATGADGNSSSVNAIQNDSIRIGWISDLSGPVAKYGSMEAGQMAVDEINAKGGINGKKIELIVEDGKCNPKAALDAVNKLIFADGVKFILGGHCSPESVTIAPLVEKNKVIMIASSTTSPLLTPMGDYVFRTSPISTVQADLDANIAINKYNYKTVAIIFAQTDYARPIAERMRDVFTQMGGKVLSFHTYQQNASDFRDILAKVAQEKPDFVFLSPQNSDEALQLLKQMKELNINSAIFGNEQLYNTKVFANSTLNEGVITSGPKYGPENQKTKEFIERYNARYGMDPPFGVWTAEAYDAVYLLAKAIEQEGENPDKVKDYLYTVKDYSGASGSITINSNGDGVREYVVRVIKNGKMVPLE